MMTYRVSMTTKPIPKTTADIPPHLKIGRLTLVISESLMERIRNAAFWTPGETLSGLGERAVELEIERLEKQNGGPFAPRTQAVRRGRPPT
jgi:hypothetical protein